MSAKDSYSTAINFLRDRDRLRAEGKPFPSDEKFLKMLADVLPTGPQTPISRSAASFPSDYRKVLEASNLPIEVAVAIADALDKRSGPNVRTSERDGVFDDYSGPDNEQIAAPQGNDRPGEPSGNRAGAAETGKPADAASVGPWKECVYKHPDAPAGPLDGWKLVPIEPTNLMIFAGNSKLPATPVEDDIDYTLQIYRAMLKAAPSATEG